MKVIIASPLLSYTRGIQEVQASGVTLGALLTDLERQFPGIRFRMIDEQGVVRKHMNLFVNGEHIRDMKHPLGPNDEIHILQALSGGC